MLLERDDTVVAGGSRVVKELMDRLGAAFMLVALAPLLLALAVAVRVTSPGPVLFRQVRVGRGGREFVMLKFRTIESGGAPFEIRQDPLVTPAGRWLRRLSLDELPQLCNVVRGHMSLVGPRPPLPQEVAAHPDDALRRLAVKPGLTGLWQISGRSDLPWEEAIRLDLRYVENWSLSLDMLILLRTLTAVARGSGAY